MSQGEFLLLTFLVAFLWGALVGLILIPVIGSWSLIPAIVGGGLTSTILRQFVDVSA